MNKKGTVFVFSGPSGSGKDTILTKLLENCDNIKLSISTITRAMRAGEVEGQKYHFVSREEFEKQLSEDAFLEHNVFLDNYYGTPKAPIEKWVSEGIDVILEIDVNGAEQIRNKLPESVGIFIMPPSYDELKRRLTGRGTESQEAIDKRLKCALEEINSANKYTYIVTNDIVEQAVQDVIHIIRAERLKTQSQEKIINEVLNKC